MDNKLYRYRNGKTSGQTLSSFSSGLFVFFLLVCLVSCSSKKETVRVDTRPNIFLVTIDSLRADFLGCYGNPIIKTPHLDRVAKKSWTFTNLFCQSPYTVSSLASIMTSLYPQQHNARNVLLQKSAGASEAESFEITDLPLQVDSKTWAGFMKNRGYMTVASVGGFTVTRSFSGLNNGFIKYDETMENLSRTASDVVFGIKIIVPGTHDKALFCWVHFFDTHFPYQADDIYMSMYKDEFFVSDLPSDCDYDLSRLKDIVTEENDIPAVNQAIIKYAAAVSLVDAQIVQLERQVIAQFKNKKNYLVFTSDHGESLVEHCELFDHGINLYNTTTRVPCLFSAGQTSGTGLGHIVNEVCRSIDIWPTIDDYLGYSSAQDDRAGRSLKPLLAGLNTDLVPVLIEGKVTHQKAPEMRNRALVSANWKLIVKSVANKQIDLLFDLAVDPMELNNIASSHNDTVTELKNTLDSFKQLRTEIDTEKVQATTQDEDTKDKLRSLGYLGD